MIFASLSLRHTPWLRCLLDESCCFPPVGRLPLIFVPRPAKRPSSTVFASFFFRYFLWLLCLVFRSRAFDMPGSIFLLFGRHSRSWPPHFCSCRLFSLVPGRCCTTPDQVTARFFGAFFGLCDLLILFRLVRRQLRLARLDFLLPPLPGYAAAPLPPLISLRSSFLL